MAFVTINAQTIPVRSGDIQKQYIEAGSAQRAIDNSYVSSRHGKLKRQWRLRTKPLLRAQSDALLAILQRRGDHWDWPASPDDLNPASTDAATHSTRGTAPDAFANATIVPGFAEDGGRVQVGVAGAFETPFTRAVGALWSGLGTANILSSANADPNVSGNLAAVASGSLATESVFRWRGTGSVEVTTTGAGDGVATADTAGVSNSTWVGSVHVRGDAGGEALTVRLIGDSTGTVATANFTLGSDPTVWQRLSVSGATVGDTTLRLEVVSQSGTPTFYVDGLQIEDNTRVTAWQNPAAARSGTQDVDYPPRVWQAIGKGSFTLNAWVRLDNPTASSRYIVDVSEGDTNSNRFSLFVTGAGIFQTFLRRGGVDYLLHMGPSLTANVWEMVTVVYDATVPSLTLYQDGALDGADTTPTGMAPDFTNASEFVLGQIAGKSVQRAPGPIAAVSVLPYPVAASTVSAWWASGAPAAGANASPLVVTGDILDAGESSVLAYCEVQPIAYAPRSIDGGWRNNAQVVDFVLQEA